MERGERSSGHSQRVWTGSRAPRRTGLGCGETHRHRLVLVVPLGARLRGAAGVLALARAEHSLIDFVPEGEAKQGAKAL